MIHLADIRREFGPTLRLAAPLALAELGWMAMGLVDTVMVGPLGPAAVGAAVLANMVFYPLAMSFMGLLFGMDTLVAQAFGARAFQDARRTLINGLWLGVGVTPFSAALTIAVVPIMWAVGANPRVMVECVPYMRALLWSLMPLFLYTAFRRYLQAVDIVKPITYALVSANIINFIGDWALIYGHWGLPAMGLEGSGWATAGSRLYLALFLAATVLWHERKADFLLFALSWRPDWSRIRELIRLGLPAAGQIAFEGGVFGIVTLLAARLDEVSLAAHGISIEVVSTTFMVPLGISSAAAVRVGQAVGRRDRRGVAAAGWAALSVAAAFMSAAGILLWTAPASIIRLFISEPGVVAAGVTLLRIAALFQLFDGLQIVATGALRGVGDTRTPMLVHLAGYWAIGMPVAYYLCFSRGWGAPGIWVGLSAALILIGATLAFAWKVRSSKAHW